MYEAPLFCACSYCTSNRYIDRSLFHSLSLCIDARIYIYIYIYIYTRNAWAVPRRCSVERPHSQSNVVATLHSVEKINKDIREY